MICSNENSILENLGEISRITLTLNKLEGKEYNFIEDKKNEKYKKFIDILLKVIKECFLTLLYLLLIIVSSFFIVYLLLILT